MQLDQMDGSFALQQFIQSQFERLHFPSASSSSFATVGCEQLTVDEIIQMPPDQTDSELWQYEFLRYTLLL
jgi:hypothetical protein